MNLTRIANILFICFIASITLHQSLAAPTRDPDLDDDSDIDLGDTSELTGEESLAYPSTSYEYSYEENGDNSYDGDSYDDDDYSFESYFCDNQEQELQTEQLCDRVRDCEDGSDEFYETCIAHGREVDNEDDFTQPWIEPTEVATTTAQANTQQSETTLESEERNAGTGDYEEYYDDFDYDDCLEDEYQCPDYICVPRAALCDGYYDCSDGADEENCPENRALNQDYDYQKFIKSLGDDYNNQYNDDVTTPEPKVVEMRTPPPTYERRTDGNEEGEEQNSKFGSSFSILPQPDHMVALNFDKSPSSPQHQSRANNEIEMKPIEHDGDAEDASVKILKKIFGGDMVRTVSDQQPQVPKVVASKKKHHSARQGAQLKVKKTLGKLVKQISLLAATTSGRDDRRRKGEKVEFHLRISDKKKRKRKNNSTKLSDGLKLEMNVEFTV